MIINILVAGSRGNIFGGALRHLIYVYINQRQPLTQLISLSKEQYVRECRHGDQTIQLNISDTLGIENYSPILMSVSKLQNSDAAYTLVYSSDDRASFEDIINKWAPLIHKRRHTTPVILVCAKPDIRQHAQHNNYTGNTIITRDEGENVARNISNCQYIECNLQDLNQVNAVFIAAINASVQFQLAQHASTPENDAHQIDQPGLAHLVEEPGSLGLFGLSTDNRSNKSLTFKRSDSLAEQEENTELHTQHENDFSDSKEVIEEEISKSPLEENPTRSNLCRPT